MLVHIFSLNYFVLLYMTTLARTFPVGNVCDLWVSSRWRTNCRVLCVNPNVNYTSNLEMGHDLLPWQRLLIALGKLRTIGWWGSAPAIDTVRGSGGCESGPTMWNWRTPLLRNYLCQVIRDTFYRRLQGTSYALKIEQRDRTISVWDVVSPLQSRVNTGITILISVEALNEKNKICQLP